MDVIYEISSFSDLTVNEVRVKIHLRMPSGTYFLKFKQALSQVASHETASLVVSSESACDQSVRTNFLQLCRQLDNFVEGIFQLHRETCEILLQGVVEFPRNPLALVLDG